MTDESASDFLEGLYAGAIVGDDASVDYVYQRLRRRREDGDVGSIEQILRDANVQRVSLGQALAILTITRAVEGDAAVARADFHARATEAFSRASGKIQSNLRALR